MIVVIVVRRRNKLRRIDMAAMARAAGDGCAGIVELRDVLGIDLVDHADHQPRRFLLRLGIVGKVQHGTAIGHLVGGIGGVACRAFGAEGAGPLVHDLVDLFAGEGLGQDLEICGRRGRRMFVLRGWGLGNGSEGESGACGRDEDEAERGSDVQADNSSNFGMEFQNQFTVTDGWRKRES